MKDKLIMDLILKKELALDFFSKKDLSPACVKSWKTELEKVNNKINELCGGLQEADYEEFITIYAHSLSVGNTAYVYEWEDSIVKKYKIVHAIYRSDNPDEYDKIDSDAFINMCPVEYDASGEFNTDEDSVYLFLQDNDKEDKKPNNKAKLIVVCKGSKEENEDLLKSLKDSLIDHDVAAKFPTIDIFSDEVRKIKDLDKILVLLANLVKTEKDSEKCDLLWGAYNLVRKLKYHESDFIEIEEGDKC